MSYVDYPWLRERRGIIYDALHAFVNTDGYRLSDRVWRADQVTRNRIDTLLAYEIRNGTAAVDIAKLLEQYLVPGREKIRTRKPYGKDGSYDALRLARTEVTAAAGRLTMAAAEANPFTRALQWALSLSHPDGINCECEDNASRDSGLGPGVYELGKVPRYPAHPHCLCHLRQVMMDTAEVVADLREWIRGGESRKDYSELWNLSNLFFHFQEMWGMLEWVRG